jgi:hypothetical protein
MNSYMNWGNGNYARAEPEKPDTPTALIGSHDPASCTGQAIASDALRLSIKALRISSQNEAAISQHMKECREGMRILRNVMIGGFTLIGTAMISFLGYLLS